MADLIGYVRPPRHVERQGVSNTMIWESVPGRRPDIDVGVVAAFGPPPPRFKQALNAIDHAAIEIVPDPGNQPQLQGREANQSCNDNEPDDHVPEVGIVPAPGPDPVEHGSNCDSEYANESRRPGHPRPPATALGIRKAAATVRIEALGLEGGDQPEASRRAAHGSISLGGVSHGSLSVRECHVS